MTSPPSARLREVRVSPQLVEQFDAEVELAVEEVGLEVADVNELPESADLRVQREALAVPEQVRLLYLRRGDEILDAGEAGADLERPGGTLRHFDDGLDLVGRRAFARRGRPTRSK